jgi:hypothetical protein
MLARHWAATDGGCVQNGWCENSFARIDGRGKRARPLHTYQRVSGNGGLFDFSDPELIAVMSQVFTAENRVNRPDAPTRSGG